MPKIEIIRDSTQISSFLDCKQLWSYEHKEHLQLTMAKPNDAMRMGSYGHEMLEIYYKMRAQGYNINDSLERALVWNPDEEFCVCGHGLKNHYKVDAVNHWCTLCLGEVVCHPFNATTYPLDNDKRNIVRERLQNYTFRYANDDFIPTSLDHVEVGFSHKLFESSDRLYILEGKMDLLMNHRGLSTWCDHKFQLSAHELYPKDIQFRNYDLVAQSAVACINYIRLTKKFDESTYVRRWFGFSIVERQFWHRRLISIYDKMFEIEQRGLTPNDYNWGMCKGKWGTNCAFTSLCEESYLPNVVKNKKAQLYHVKPIWKPW